MVEHYSTPDDHTMSPRERHSVFSRLTLAQAERVWPSIAICEHGELCPICCWEWQKPCDHNGYGKMYTGLIASGRGITHVHRLVYALVYGDFPPHLSVCHRCDNPPCCNPAHLWLGTNLENVRDMVQKGRQRRGDTHQSRLHPECRPRGERQWCSKLTEAQVLQIRALPAPLNISAISRQFGVARITVKRILNRRIWAHLP